MSPINVAKQLIDDARINNKEIWLYLQDLSKCYDRVDTRILRHAMTRLKIPLNFIDLVIDLFTNRRNYVLTDVGKTPDYEVLVGIDQGEVISPLLWCIYYDPLLTKVQQSSHLGYKFRTALLQTFVHLRLPLKMQRSQPLLTWTILYGSLVCMEICNQYFA